MLLGALFRSAVLLDCRRDVVYLIIASNFTLGKKRSEKISTRSPKSCFSFLISSLSRLPDSLFYAIMHL